MNEWRGYQRCARWLTRSSHVGFGRHEFKAVDNKLSKWKVEYLVLKGNHPSSLFIGKEVATAYKWEGRGCLLLFFWLDQNTPHSIFRLGTVGNRMQYLEYKCVALWPVCLSFSFSHQDQVTTFLYTRIHHICIVSNIRFRWADNWGIVYRCATDSSEQHSFKFWNQCFSFFEFSCPTEARSPIYPTFEFGRPGLNLRSSHTKDSKSGTWYLLA